MRSQTFVASAAAKTEAVDLLSVLLLRNWQRKDAVRRVRPLRRILACVTLLHSLQCFNSLLIPLSHLSILMLLCQAAFLITEICHFLR